MNQDPAARDKIVYVPVQEKHLGAVHRALADAYADEMKGVAPVEAEPLAAATEGASAPGESAQYSKSDLTQDEIVRLKQTYANQGIHSLMNTLADQAGEWMSFPQLMDATGRSRPGLNADLGGLTRFVRSEFGKDRWPMEIKLAPDGTTLYRLSPEMARWWKEA